MTCTENITVTPGPGYIGGHGHAWHYAGHVALEMATSKELRLAVKTAVTRASSELAASPWTFAEGLAVPEGSQIRMGATWSAALPGIATATGTGLAGAAITELLVSAHDSHVVQLAPDIEAVLRRGRY